MTNEPRPAARLIGVDVGGTKTHVSIVDTTGASDDLVVPSSTWRSGELFADPGNLPRLADVIAGLRPLAGDSVVVVGMHGCDTEAQIAEATRVLTRLLERPVTVVNDAQLLGFAEQEGPSLQMIVGTGAVISGALRDGTRVSVDGYGWPLGDRGSAHDIVSAALREALLACDRGDADSDPLVGALFSAFGATDAPGLAVEATAVAGAAEWGAHAPLVFEQAALGSPIARRIIEDSAQTLASGVASLRQRGAVGTTLVAGGGVIVNQPAYEQRIRERLAALEPDVDFVVVRRPPVVGAVAHARVLAGRDVAELAS
jgi:N-acetylglucosamine kinase-like BadF-type ATPase